MNRLIKNKNRRIILIGGTSHVGKSTLGKYLANKLGWSYLATDRLAKHPGRPWSENGQAVREHVVQHYQTLSVEALVLDVWSHYQKNVLPQIETIVQRHRSDLSKNCLVIEGSALYPGLVTNLSNENDVSAIWLVASEQLLQNRIFNQSNFSQLDQASQQLVQKFLERTLLYQQYIKDELEGLQFRYIDPESEITLEELAQKFLKLIYSEENT